MHVNGFPTGEENVGYTLPSRLPEEDILLLS